MKKIILVLIITTLPFLMLGLSCNDKINIPNQENPWVESPGNLLIDTAPAWSADGTKILYSHYDLEKKEDGTGYWILLEKSGLYIMDANGSNKNLVVHGLDFEVSWHPAEDLLVVSNEGDLFVAAVEDDTVNTEDHQLIAFGQQWIRPKWNFDGTKIAFQKEYDDIHGASGTHMMEYPSLADEFVDFSYFGAWYNDSNKMLLTDWGANETAVLYTYDITTSTASDTIDPNLDGFISNPSFSPDGQRIVFQIKPQAQDEGPKIYIVYNDGSTLRKLADGYFPRWSPNSDKILFTGNVGGDLNDNINDNGTIWVINADGTGLQQLTFGPPE